MKGSWHRKHIIRPIIIFNPYHQLSFGCVCVCVGCCGVRRGCICGVRMCVSNLVCLLSAMVRSGLRFMYILFDYLIWLIMAILHHYFLYSLNIFFKILYVV